MEVSGAASTADLSDQIQKIWGDGLSAAKEVGQTVNVPHKPSEMELQALKKTMGEIWSHSSKQQEKAKQNNDNVEEARETREVKFASDRLRNKDPESTDHILVGQDAYTLKTQIGKGGMGMVFSADQASLGREVAVKMLEKETDLWTPENVSFVREALITAGLAHPNIVPVHHFGRDERGLTYIVMKKVKGQSWHQLLHPKKKDGEEDQADQPGQSKTIKATNSVSDLAQQLEIFQKVCDAIAFAHHRQVIHRDIKPDNVMVGDYGEVTVMDWGLALDLSQKSTMGLDTPEVSQTVAGSPAYMAPEMVLAKIDKLGPRTDIYLLGATLYEILTGVPPHRGKTVYDALKHAAFGSLDQIVLRDGLPMDALELDRIVRKAMSKEPEARYKDVAQLQKEVRAYQARQGDRLESNALAKQARSTLNRLKKKLDKVVEGDDLAPFYPRCTDILALTRLSLKLWGYNPRAISVQQDCLVMYADLSMRSRDWGLGESLLRDLKLTGASGVIQAGRLEKKLNTLRETWDKREYFLRRTARGAALVTIFAAGLSIYFYWNWRAAQEKVDAYEAANPRVPRRNIPDPKNGSSKDDPAANAGGDPTPDKKEKDPDALTKPPVDTVELIPLKEPWKMYAVSAGDEPGFKKACLLSGLAKGPKGLQLLWDGEGRAWRWEGNGFEPPEKPLSVRRSEEHVVAAVWMNDRKVVLAHRGGMVRVGYAANRPWNIVFTSPKPIHAIAAMSSAGSSRIAVASKNLIWRPSERGEKTKHHRLSSNVLCLGYRQDGTLIAVVEQGLWFLKSDGKQGGKPLSFQVDRAVLADKGTRVLAVPKEKGRERTVVLLRTSKSKVLRTYEFPNGAVTALAVNADATKFLAGSKAGELVYIDGDKPPAVNVKRFNGAVLSVSFSSDGNVGYALDSTGQVFTWDLSGAKVKRDDKAKAK